LQTTAKTFDAKSKQTHQSPLHTKNTKKFELMLTRRAKAYISSGSVVKLKIGVFTLS